MHHHAPIRSKRKDDVQGLSRVISDVCRCGARRTAVHRPEGTYESSGWVKSETVEDPALGERYRMEGEQ